MQEFQITLKNEKLKLYYRLSLFIIIILTLLYMVPLLGLITLGVTGMWGLGAVVMAVFAGARRESPARRNGRPPETGSGAAMNVAATAPLGAAENANPAGSPTAATFEG